MNSEERRILKDAIGAVCRYNEHAWWQLKRETFDHGFQSYYPAQSMFDLPAEVVVGALSAAQLAQLQQAWTGAWPPPADNGKFIRHYANAIVAEVVRRARIAGVRTENW